MAELCGERECGCIRETLRDKLPWVEAAWISDGVLVVQHSYPVGHDIVRQWVQYFIKQLAPGRVHEYRLEEVAYGSGGVRGD